MNDWLSDSKLRYLSEVLSRIRWSNFLQNICSLRKTLFPLFDFYFIRPAGSTTLHFTNCSSRGGLEVRGQRRSTNSCIISFFSSLILMIWDERYLKKPMNGKADSDIASEFLENFCYLVVFPGSCIEYVFMSLSILLFSFDIYEICWLFHLRLSFW